MGLPSRRTRLLGVVLAVMATGVLGFVAGAHIRSPADALADAAPPRASVLTAPVRGGALEPRSIGSGTIEWSRTITVPAVQSANGLRSVVTRRNSKPGDSVAAGQVLVEIAYRPVIVLPGPVPMLRDLRRGDRGPDVAELQDALEAVGHPVSDADGVFGASTERALVALYRAVGYEPPTVAAPGADGATESGSGQEWDSAGETEPPGGVGAPAAELLFVERLPARVLSLSAQVGQDLGESVAVLAEGKPLVRANLPVADAAALDPGARVTLHVASTGAELPGRVSAIGPTQRSEELGLFVPVTIRPDRTIAPKLVGTRVDVGAEPVAGRSEGVLVPVSALFTSASTGTSVRRVTPGDDDVVPVRVLETSAGAARVLPVGTAKLAVGDEVVIGVTR